MSQAELKSAIEYHRQGDLDEATRRYRAILEDEPEHADALHLLGVIALQRGAVEEAETLIQRALALRPESGAYTCSLGNLRRAQGRLDDARACYEKSVDLDPNLADGYNNLGLLLMGEGDLEGAERNFKMALVVNADDGQTLNNMGYALLRQERFDAAVSYLMRAAQTAPGSALVQANLGSALRANGTPGLAVKCFENAIDIRPDFDRAHTELGQVLAELHRPDDARGEFEKAIEIRPENTEARVGLARLLREAGELEASLEQLEAALAHPAQDASLIGELARTYLDLGRVYPATESARAWLRLEPENVDAHLTLGHALALSGHFDEARQALNRAASIAPDNAQVHCLSAIALEQGGQLADSEQAADRALALDPEQSDAHAVKARNALRAGRLPQAREQLHMALAGGADGLARIELEDALALTLEQEGDAGAALEASLRAHGLRARTPGTVVPIQPKPDTLLQYAQMQNAERFQDWPDQAPDDGRPRPVFLFAMPGCGLQTLGQALQTHPGLAVLTDRFGPGFERPDVFTAEHVFGKLHELDDGKLGIQRRQYWRGAQRALGGDLGERVLVDLLPAEQSLLDIAYRYFPESRMVWLVRDPRAALVEGIIGPHDGRLPGYQFLNPDAAAAYLAALCRLFHAFAIHLPSGVARVPYEALDEDPGTALAPLYEACGVQTNAAVDKALSRIQSGALPPRPFTEAAGQRHRAYSEALASAMQALQEPAGLLGYDPD